MTYTDVKYIESVRTYLRNFKRKANNLYNFSCWYCGDSEKNPRKARGYFIEKDGRWVYYCHNCNKSTSLKNFLRDLDYDLFKEYLKETLEDNDDSYRIHFAPTTHSPKQRVEDKSKLSAAAKLSELPPEHHALQFVRRRKIPQAYHNVLRYTDNFREFTNSIIPGKFDHVGKADSRIIIPFFKPGGSLIGYQGRALYKTDLRYITIMIDEDAPKLWNWDRCDFTKPYFITEGPFDGMFLSNACAMAGADWHPMEKDNAILVFDNEPRNPEIIRRYEKMIEQNYRVCIWPDYIEQKDINDMVLAGLNPEEIIWENLYRGLSAKVKLNEWRKWHG